MTTKKKQKPANAVVRFEIQRETQEILKGEAQKIGLIRSAYYCTIMEKEARRIKLRTA
jgi:hypothetical protein